MRPRKSGAIVLLSSLDGLQAEHGMFSYCTSKGALLNLARAAALDLARDQVRVNCVCPSVTVTPLLEGRLAQVAEWRRDPARLCRAPSARPRPATPRHRRRDRFRHLARRDRNHRRRASRSTPASAPPGIISAIRPGLARADADRADRADLDAACIRATAANGPFSSSEKAAAARRPIRGDAEARTGGRRRDPIASAAPVEIVQRLRRIPSPPAPSRRTATAGRRSAVRRGPW